MSTEERLEELLLEWEERAEAGRPATAAELCADCPSLVGELQRRIDALGKVGWVAPAFVPGAEPVPGYRLVSLLGRGGFGQVWRATGPGNFEVALKILSRDGSASRTESRALDTIRGIRHPNLLALVGCWETADWLVLAMELADRSLHDRLLDARTAGLTGIPVEELLEYIRQAAAGIDHLHADGFQHRDIKPQNLLLQGGGVKVADFGLAKAVSGTTTGHTGALTVAYAAPEFFDGKTSQHSDQYSLAVTYCQLRCDRLPFDGTTAQMFAGHLSRAPDLSLLEEGERAVVARALAKKPAARWPSCTAFADALIRARSHPEPLKALKVKRWLAGASVVGVASLLVAFANPFSKNEQEKSPPDKAATSPVVEGERVPLPPEVAVAPALRPVPVGRPAPGRQFVFNGRGRIVTPVERFAPVTLEAWVRIERADGGRPERTIIGSDIPGRSGVSIGLDFGRGTPDPLLGGQLLPAPSVVNVPTNVQIPLGRWTHLAAAFGETETVLFRDGKMVARGARSASVGGTPFVVGNAGKDNPDHYFVGAMRAVRISKGVRYTDDFFPPPAFSSDEATVVIYDADAVEGRTATDLSGNGNHGVMTGMTVGPMNGND